MAFLDTGYKALVSGQRRGLPADLARGVLRLLSVAYACLVMCRNAYYDLVKRSAQSVSRPVISVGNITVGGTGKTPTAVFIANLLAQRGRKVAVLLRGYKGRAIQFDDEQRDQAAKSWRMESDEAMLLRRRCPRAQVIVNPDRLAAARRAIAKGADAIVLDDGFQHRRIARDLDIVLIDATAPFGYGHHLPRGLLRESRRSLRRADLIVLTRSDQTDETNRALLLRSLRRSSNGKPVIQAVHRITGFTDVKGHAVEVDDHTVMQAVIFAGIASFEGFRRAVEKLGVRVLAAYQYPDHHDYTGEELAGLASAAANIEANVILTTEKDAVKLVGRWDDDGCRLLVLVLEVAFRDEGDSILADAIDAIIQPSPARAPRSRVDRPE